MSSRWNRFSVATIGAVILMLSGCGAETKNPGVDLEPVTGTVTMGGSPLAGASVVFQGAEYAAAGTTDEQGKFTLTTFDPGDGAVQGSYKVTVAKVEVTGGDTSYQDPKSPNFGSTPPPDAQPTRKYIVAEKFSKPDTSGLTADVKSGANDFPFEVTGS